MTAAPNPTPWTEAELMHLAARGALKVDLLGQRGTTLVTCDELAAMAAILLMRVTLPADILTPKTLLNGGSHV